MERAFDQRLPPVTAHRAAAVLRGKGFTAFFPSVIGAARGGRLRPSMNATANVQKIARGGAYGVY